MTPSEQINQNEIYNRAIIDLRNIGEFTQSKRKTDKGIIFIAKVIVEGKELREESEDIQLATIKLRNQLN